jgi:hypothetical protein
MGNDKNVGKQDRSVEAETPDRLQRDLDGEIRIVAEVEKAAGRFRVSRYSGKIPARLPHEPDRRGVRVAPLSTSSTIRSGVIPHLYPFLNTKESLLNQILIL